MEIILAKKTHKEHKITNPYSTAQQLLFTQKVCQKNKLPTAAINQILKNCLLLENKNLPNSTEMFMRLWHDFGINILFYHLLIPQQICLLKKLFASKPSLYLNEDRQCEIHYHLKSNKDYKLFSTLPTEIRRCLTQLPLSEAIKPLSIRRVPVETILVKNTSKAIIDSGLIILGTADETLNMKFFGHKAKLIVPEDNNNF